MFILILENKLSCRIVPQINKTAVIGFGRSETVATTIKIPLRLQDPSGDSISCMTPLKKLIKKKIG